MRFIVTMSERRTGVNYCQIIVNGFSYIIVYDLTHSLW